MQERGLKIAVAGGTGPVGHHVVEVLKSRGHRRCADGAFHWCRRN
jgi:nucleoside-diphosphate-sugar epimerase